jgi:HAD superfamily phosphatase (TIGR01668 family)
MIFYPKSYFRNILDIDIDFLLKNNIKAVLLDIDNTILDYKNNIPEGLEDWVKNAKNNNIKFCILSNTNKKKKAQKMSKLLDIPYIYFAKKPLKYGFKKAKEILNIEENNTIAVIGDQVLTDVLGANRCNMYSILVKPLHNKDIFVTKINRLIENKILRKYFKENNINDK